ncbi:anti-sigma factor family protein, partial [Streptomyces mirabilis]
MSNDMTCEKLREIGAELALGILPGRERAAAVAHLDRCADCREYVEQLTLVGDGLIGLLPGCEPPVGFETRVAQALTTLYVTVTVSPTLGLGLSTVMIAVVVPSIG